MKLAKSVTGTVEIIRVRDLILSSNAQPWVHWNNEKCCPLSMLSLGEHIRIIMNINITLKHDIFCLEHIY